MYKTAVLTGKPSKLKFLELIVKPEDVSEGVGGEKFQRHNPSGDESSSSLGSFLLA
jgi:hypothetical protein